MQVHREGEDQQQANFSGEIKAHLSTIDRLPVVVDHVGDLVVDQCNRPLELTLVSTYLVHGYLLHD